MSFDILEQMNSTLGGPLIRRASAYFGETERNTHSALRSIEPALLAGLMQWASTPAGATAVFQNVMDDKVDASIAGKLPGLFANRDGFDALIETGESLAERVFGNRTGGVTNAISQVSGVTPDSALTLTSMTAPLLFGLIRKYVTQNNLNSVGLLELLQGQRHSLEKRAFDDRIVSALGFGSKTELLSALPAVAATRAATVVPLKSLQQRKWLPWAVAAGVAVLGLLLFVNRTAERGDAETASSRSADDPMRLAIAPTRVYFEDGETSIGPEDRQRIASAAASARTHDRSVAITGYTHRVGNEDENYELAKDRAYAVRDALVDAGIAEEKIIVDQPAFVAESVRGEEARRVDIDMK